MLYGHRRDVDGYAKALAYFDEKLPEIQAHMKPDDILMITADHGCDPAYTATTDHTREYTPFLMYGAPVTPGNRGTRPTFPISELRYWIISESNRSLKEALF